MATNTLKRKKLKNKMRAIAKQKTIKRLKTQPVIKNIDIDAIKSSFKGEEKSAE